MAVGADSGWFSVGTSERQERRRHQETKVR